MGVMTVTLSQNVRFAPPADSLDRLRYNARLELAGVPQEAIAAGHISPEVADKFVKGGFASLFHASTTTGRAGVIDPGDVMSLAARTSPMAAVFGFVGMCPADRSDKRAATAAAAATKLDDLLTALSRNLRVSPLEVIAQLNDVRCTLERALEPGHLAHMSQSASDSLKASLSALHASMDNCRLTIKGQGRIVTLDSRFSDGLRNLASNRNRVPALLGQLLSLPPPAFDLIV